MRDIKNRYTAHVKHVYWRGWLSRRHRGDPVVSQLLQAIEQLPFSCEHPQVLDVAVGTGSPITKRVLEKEAVVTGVDLACPLLELCRSECPGVRVVCADAEKLPFGSDVFDMTMCVRSSWYFPDFYSALSEMARVTKPRGYVCFDTMNGMSPIALDNQLKYYVSRGIKRLLRAWQRSRQGASGDDRIPVILRSPLEARRRLRRLGLSELGVVTPSRFGTMSMRDLLAVRIAFVCQKLG